MKDFAVPVSAHPVAKAKGLHGLIWSKSMPKKVFIAAAIIVLCSLALLWKSHQNGSQAHSDSQGRIIAYVPLDDRTDNLEDVIYLSEAAGFQIVLPEGDTYCTKLDGQTVNSNGTQYGDREALFQWVQEMDEQGCDLFLLSLDQLFSGGLVNSRSMTESTPLSFSDGSTLDEMEAFDRFILTLTEDDNNRLYLFDSVVRLASTVAYEGLGLEEYNALRAYGMVNRPVLPDNALTLENIFAQYPYASDGVTRAEDCLEEESYRAVLTDELLSDYISVRERKLRLTDYVITALEQVNPDQVRLLIGIDDSSANDNIQRNEIRYLEQRLGERGTVLAGVDSLARLLVGLMARDLWSNPVTVSVRYIGGSEDQPASAYDTYSLETVVERHLTLFNAEEGDDFELQFLIMTAPDTPERSSIYCEELVSCLEENQEQEIPTVLIETSNNAYGEELEQMLLEHIQFAELIAFAGKYDQAVVTGVAIAMGFSRYLYLRDCPNRSVEADSAQVQQIANSMLLTYAYLLHTRPAMNEQIQQMGLDPNNILANTQQSEQIQQTLEELFLSASEPIIRNLEGSSLPVSLQPYTKKQIVGLTVSNPYFPWNRTFEVSFTINAGELLN